MPGLPGEREIKMENLSFGQKLANEIFDEYERNLRWKDSLYQGLSETQVIKEVKRKRVNFYNDIISNCTMEDVQSDYVGFIEYHISEYERIARIFFDKFGHQ